MSQTGWTDKRPMSPHVQVWRWHATMLGSILHRATGCALYVGALMAAAWVFCVAAGADAYAGFSMIAASIPGQIVLFGFVLSALYHALNGVRHLVWDAGHGFTPKLASRVSTTILVVSIVGAVLIWWAAGLVPGVPGLINGAYP
jgi:succinate dehydrogenase / fumarate reductase cytochrome b subunit